MSKITTIDLPTKNEICDALHAIESYSYTVLTNDLVTGKYFFYSDNPRDAPVIEKAKAAGIPTTEYDSVQALQATRPDIDPASFAGFDEFNVRRHGHE